MSATKFVDIGNDNRLPRCVSMAANAFVKIDPRTRERPLKRPENELAFLFHIKPDPEKSKNLFQNGGDIREICNEIGLAVY